MTQQFNSLLDMLKVFSDEQKCIDHLAAVRWKNGIFCPHCGSVRKVHKFSDNRRYKCADCLQQFTVKVGTVFEDSKLPLQKWFMAFYLVTSHKKGISSMQLAKDITVTQKTAWFMLQRIRYIVGNGGSFDGTLGGVVEADETFIGGKEKNKHKNKRTEGTQGRGSQKTKAIVLGMVAREGAVKMQHVDNLQAATIGQHIEANVSPNAFMMTDEARFYNEKSLKNRPHARVNHGLGEYVNGPIYTNTIEGAFSHFKRCIYGIYHSVSKKHLQKYASMFEFRWNTREMGEGQRVNFLLSKIEGAHLTYKELIA
jgi:transposase-like protein